MINPAPRTVATFDLQRACRTLHGLVGAEESGQADAPLTKAALKLCEEPLTDDTPKVALLAFNPEVLVVVLSYLLGDDCTLPINSLFTKWQTGCIELAVQGHAFSVVHGSHSQELSSRDDFLKAVEKGAPEGNPAALFQPLRLGLPVQSGFFPVRLLIPASVRELRKQPRLVSYITDDANFLLLVGSGADNCDLAERSILEDLVTDISVIQPVVVDEFAHGKIPSWVQFKASFVFPPVFITPGPPHGAKGRDLFAEEFRSARELIFRYRVTRRTEILLALARNKTQEEIDLCQRKKQMRDAGQQFGAGDDGQIKKSVDRVVVRLNEEFKALSISVDDISRNALLTSGPIYEFVRGRQREYSLEDLILTDKESITCVELKQEVADRLQAETKVFLQEFLITENAIVVDGIGVAVEEAVQTFSTIMGELFRPQIPAFDESRFNLYQDILLKSKPKYVSEITRHKKFEIILQAIQAPVMIYMAITMPITMLSGLDIMATLRTWKGKIGLVVAIPLYIYCTYDTIRKFKTQRETALAKELTRVRDLVDNERERLFKQVLEERKKHLADYFSRCLDALRKQIDGAVAEFSRKKEQQRLKDREENVAQVQLLDRRLRDYTSRLQQYDGLSRELEQGKRTLEAAFQSSLTLMKV